MPNRLLILVLIVCMCWQSLAFAGAGAVLTDGDEQRHEQLHFEDVAHHHDDHGDEGVHEDDSDASVTHVVLDAGLFAPALTSVASLPVPEQAPERPLQAALPTHPLPFLDGLERPPRLTA